MNWQIAVAPPPGGAARGQVLPVVPWTLAVLLNAHFLDPYVGFTLEGGDHGTKVTPALCIAGERLRLAGAGRDRPDGA